MKYGISPLYQVMEQIECYILEKGLKSHDKFPGERRLCEEFDCNRVTPVSYTHLDFTEIVHTRM